MSELGLSDDDFIVVYDGSGANLSAARAWWMFRIFGHAAVAVLDGGLGQWRREGRALESGEVHLPPGGFSAVLDSRQVRSLDEVRQALEGGSAQVVDVRARGRFEAIQPEPRPGLRSGHVPGSRNLPYDELVDPDGKLLPGPALLARLTAAGIDPARAIITMCGSGVSACALALVLEQLGGAKVAVYDGSWTEWGGRLDVAVATGPAGEIP
jgi:thiosulfate/3-mercaptopyruvate sulfurtransferase